MQCASREIKREKESEIIDFAAMISHFAIMLLPIAIAKRKHNGDMKPKRLSEEMNKIARTQKMMS